MLKRICQVHHLQSSIFLFQAPEKKPLVRRDPVEDVQAKVRKGSQKIVSNPVEDLSEFHNQDETI